MGRPVQCPETGDRFHVLYGSHWQCGCCGKLWKVEETLHLSKFDFSCFHCHRAISPELVGERMKAPPGECEHCGGVVIFEERPGALEELQEKLGIPVRKIEVPL